MSEAIVPLAITMGDPAGIGPEVSLKAIAAPRLQTESVHPLLLLGDADILVRVADRCQLPLPPICGSWPESLAQFTAGQPAVIWDLSILADGAVQPGTISALTGAAACQYIDRAIDLALAGQVCAIATGPIHKEALRAAGIPYPGHTELFAARTAAARACMMLTAPELTCAFVTTHVGYWEVPNLLSVARILDVIQLSHDAMVKMRGRTPKLVVCGLNPHAGEHGLFGQGEEERLIEPAIRQAQAQGIDAVGPLPPDTAFLPARRQVTDCYICMYHDQGHILLKALAFDRAVNTTLGLPIIRTSVDHGTALDIAWQGKADESSMVEAILLAEKLARQNPATCSAPQALAE